MNFFSYAAFWMTAGILVGLVGGYFFRGRSSFSGSSSESPDLKRLENGEKSLSLLEATLDSTADGILVVDNQGKMVRFNKKFLEMWRIPEPIRNSRNDEAALKFVLNQLVDPQGFLSKVRGLYSRTDAESFDVLEFKDGRVFERYSKPQKLGTKSVGRVWSFRDVTEMKRSEKDLRQTSTSKDYLNKIINSIADPLFVKDRRHRWVLLNDAYCRFMGYPREALIGKSEQDFFPKEEAAVFWKKDEEVFISGRTNLNEESFTDATGFHHYIVRQKSLYVNSRGEKFIVGTVRDITASKQAETALRESKDYLDKIINTMGDPIFVKDQQYRLVLMNDAYCEVWNKPKEVLLGTTDYDFLQPQVADVCRRKDEEVFASGEESLNEESFADGRGEMRHTLVRKSVFTDQKGQKFLVGALLDITKLKEAELALLQARDELERRVQERTAELSRVNDELRKGILELRRAEEELKQSEKQYRDLVETSHDLIWSVDAEGKWTFLNRQATQRIYGYKPEEMLGRVFTEFESPEQAKKDIEVFSHVKAGRPYYQYETVHFRKDGSPVYLSYNAIVRRDKEGKILGTTGTATDVTARKLAEEKLRESEERTRTIIDHALDAVIVIDEAGRVAYWNPQAERIFGWSSLEAMERNVVEMAVPVRFHELYGRIRKRFLKTGQKGMLNRRIETMVRHSDGHEFPVEITVSPLRLGGSYLFSAFIRDITEQKKAEGAIRRKTEELGRSNKELQDFAYVASHDLQEPLHKIIAFGDRLRANSRGSLSEKATDSLERIQNAALRMRALIEDLLRYARVTTQAKPFEAVDLGEVIREVLSVLELRIAESKARVEVEPLPSVCADRSQMLQLFQNLIGNALKFVRPGESPHVVIRAQSPRGDGFEEIVVEDHGIGFEEKFSELVFKPFQRLQGRNEYEGTGMGLAICQKIVTRHGGTISVQSVLGRGSIFTVCLPQSSAVSEMRG